MEASSWDKEWGIGCTQRQAEKDWDRYATGKNLLGVALMEVRRLLRIYGPGLAL